MVGAAEETQLKRLEMQVENGGGGAWDYLCLLHKLKVRQSHNVLKYGLPIVNDPNLRSKLGNDGRFSIFPLSFSFFFFFYFLFSGFLDFTLSLITYLRILNECETSWWQNSIRTVKPMICSWIILILMWWLHWKEDDWWGLLFLVVW